MALPIYRQHVRYVAEGAESFWLDDKLVIGHVDARVYPQEVGAALARRFHAMSVTILDVFDLEPVEYVS